MSIAEKLNNISETNKKTKIPKIIHYFYEDVDIWQKNTSPCFRMCYASWKNFCPDYEIKLWNISMPEFKEMFSSSKFLRECYKKKLWALIADYVRHYALYNYGGIYLDTDVQLIKCFDEFLDDSLFISIEGDIYKGSNIVESAVMGGIKGHKVFKDMLDIYNSNEIFKIDYLINPVVMSEYLKKKIGFSRIEYNDSVENPYKFYESEKICFNLINYNLYVNQKIYENNEHGIKIYPSEYFCPNWVSFGEKAFSDKTVSIHWNQSSWWNYELKLKKLEALRYKNPIKRFLYINSDKIAKLFTFFIPDKNIRKNTRSKLKKYLEGKC